MSDLKADDLARGRALLAAEQAAHGTVKQAIAAYNLHKFAMEHLPALLSAASDLAALKAQIRQLVDRLDDRYRLMDWGGLPSHEEAEGYLQATREAHSDVLALLQQPEPPQERET